MSAMQSPKPILYGADYSCYVRIARLALIEKGVDHELVPVDIFAKGGPPEWYREIHPFGRIPACEHGGFRVLHKPYDLAALASALQSVRHESKMSRSGRSRNV